MVVVRFFFGQVTEHRMKSVSQTWKIFERKTVCSFCHLLRSVKIFVEKNEQRCSKVGGSSYKMRPEKIF